MEEETSGVTKDKSQLGRSIMAIGAGVILNVALAYVVDEVLHRLDVYPPWGEPMYDRIDNALALSYRLPIAVLGAAVTARLAPSSPMRHALILGGIGAVLALLGAFAAATMKLGPIWYPVTLAVTALPCAWAGARLMSSQRR